MHQRDEQPPLMHHPAGSAEIFNIARSAGQKRILGSETLRKVIFWGNFSFLNFTKFVVFHEKNLQFHDHGPEFEAAITFSIKFSRNWYLHHPKLHTYSWGWTKRYRKRMTGYKAQAKKPTKEYE